MKYRVDLLSIVRPCTLDYFFDTVNVRDIFVESADLIRDITLMIASAFFLVLYVDCELSTDSHSESNKLKVTCNLT